MSRAQWLCAPARRPEELRKDVAACECSREGPAMTQSKGQLPIRRNVRLILEALETRYSPTSLSGLAAEGVAASGLVAAANQPVPFSPSGQGSVPSLRSPDNQVVIAEPRESDPPSTPSSNAPPQQSGQSSPVAEVQPPNSQPRQDPVRFVALDDDPLDDDP